MWPAWLSDPETLRSSGIQEFSSLLLYFIRRKMWMPHCLSLPASYRSDLNGMATSMVKPWGVRTPFESITMSTL